MSKETRMRNPDPAVIERKLGRERAAGISHGGLIEIDPVENFKSKEYLDTLIHESLHERFPEWDERKVERTAHYLTRMIWRQNYRKIQP